MFQKVHLYDLYSEELNNAKQEYIVAVEKQQSLDNSIIDFNRLVQSAKTKLLLWGMSEAQVSGLTKSKRLLHSHLSTVSNQVILLNCRWWKGQYVSEGSTIVKLADLSSLWAEAQVYTSQLSAIDLKGTAIVQFRIYPAKNGKENRICQSEIVSDNRLNLVRVPYLIRED